MACFILGCGFYFLRMNESLIGAFSASSYYKQDVHQGKGLQCDSKDVEYTDQKSTILKKALSFFPAMSADNSGRVVNESTNSLLEVKLGPEDPSEQQRMNNFQTHSNNISSLLKVTLNAEEPSVQQRKTNPINFYEDLQLQFTNGLRAKYKNS